MSIDKKRLIKLVSYMATFDGGIYVPQKRNVDSKVNCYFKINMKKANLDYIEWIKETLTEITSCTITDRPDYNTDGCTRQPQSTLQSCRHPYFSKVRERLYIDGKKVIDPHMLKLMDAEALAIIFMADGSVSLTESGINSVTLNTKGFSYADNMFLGKAIYDKLGIRTTVNRQNQYYYLRVKTADAEKMHTLISPYVKESFTYKLERLAPVKGGDIVCSA